MDALVAWLDAHPEAPPGLYTGTAGLAFTLVEVHRATGAPRFRDVATGIVRRLAASAREVWDGVEWNDSTDVISGSAGIGLALVDLAARLPMPEALALARRAGERLLERAEPAPGGLRWRMDRRFPRGMPNFSHGTASWTANAGCRAACARSPAMPASCGHRCRPDPRVASKAGPGAPGTGCRRFRETSSRSASCSSIWNRRSTKR